MNESDNRKTAEIRLDLRRATLSAKTKIVTAAGTLAVALLTMAVMWVEGWARHLTSQFETIAQAGAGSEEELSEYLASLEDLLDRLEVRISDLERESYQRSFDIQLMDYKLHRILFTELGDENALEMLERSRPSGPALTPGRAQDTQLSDLNFEPRWTEVARPLETE